MLFLRVSQWECCSTKDNGSKIESDVTTISLKGLFKINYLFNILEIFPGLQATMTKE